MKEGPEFIGRAYKEEEKKAYSEALKKWSHEASIPIEGELEKTEEEVKMVESINSIVEAELKSLGIEAYDPIPPESMHILSGAVFNERFPSFEGRAFYRSTDDVIYVNRDKTYTKAGLFSDLMHEIVHRTSTKKFYADRDGSIYSARVGYRVRSPWKEPERAKRLVGFNELMTDLTVYKMLLKNQSLVEERMGITKEDIRGPIYGYMDYSPILESIVKKVAADKDSSSTDVFDDFERGLFENNIMVLKNVERSFGKGSLEILSLLQTLKEKNDNDTLGEMIKKFFTEENETERQNLRSEILAFVDKAVKDASDQEGSV